MTQKTEGIVLKTIKYGETSIIVSVLTVQFGLQNYIINGVRTSGRAGSKYILYQPCSILDLDVYNNELKNLKRIKDASLTVPFQNIFQSVFITGIATFIIEVVSKAIKESEKNEDLFEFLKYTLLYLDKCSQETSSNIAIFFMLEFSDYLGFKIEKNEGNIFDLREGKFSFSLPEHKNYFDEEESEIIRQFLEADDISYLRRIKLSGKKRSLILEKLCKFYEIHIAGFSEPKSLKVLTQLV